MLLHGEGAVVPANASDAEAFSSAADLAARLQRRLGGGEFDAVVMAAAVADYRPADSSTGKYSSDAAERTLRLVRNEKILPQLKDLFPATAAASSGSSSHAIAGAQGMNTGRVEAQFTAGGVDAVVHNDIFEIRAAAADPFWFWRSASSAPERIAGVPALADRGRLPPALLHEIPMKDRTARGTRS